VKEVISVRRTYLLVAVGLLLAAGLPVLAQLNLPAASLPVTRVVLFNSGVGYFQRSGTVEGNTRVELQFPAASINDLLKSLVLTDLGGGQVGTVTYDNRDPIEKTLKSFAIDLTENPSLGQLLQQVRGERVEVILRAERGQAGTVNGLVVGVEQQKRPAGKDEVIEVEQLNLLTTDGLRSVALNQVQQVKLQKPELEQEFRKALEVLAQAHDNRKKTVSLNFLGNGRREVRVGYVTESPIWKTSYRLDLGKDRVFLQGWAIVENTTDEDWKQVSLGLIAGRPISFQMDLYAPLYLERPVVEPELFASLRPPSYSGSLGPQQPAGINQPAGEPGAGAGMPGAPGMSGWGIGGGGPRGGSSMMPPGGAPGGLGGRAREAQELARLAEKERLDFRQGVASAAIATELGRYFQYQIEQPVSLPRQKSALLPIVNQNVEAARLSIYNENAHPKYPLHGLRFKNTSGLHLMQGPVTVFEGNSYAGDARVPDLQPNESRLLAYAIDLGVEVAPEAKPADDHLVAVKIVKGLLEATHKVRRSKTYTLKNRSEQERIVLIEYPHEAGWSLTSPAKPTERTRDLYRFEVRVAPGGGIKQEVAEEMARRHRVALTNTDDEAVRVFVRSDASSPRVKKALEEALALKAKLSETRGLIRQEEQALNVIEKDQGRMRANMERVPPTSEAYKRYLKKFDDQETEIEKRRAQVAQLQETAERQSKAYESFLANLNVE
jgi:hypothetical protein